LEWATRIYGSKTRVKTDGSNDEKRFWERGNENIWTQGWAKTEGSNDKKRFWERGKENIWTQDEDQD
jgi:hypothetical protein